MKKIRKRNFLLLITLLLLSVAVYFYWPNRWEYIVIHHSAGGFGSIEHLQKIHNQRQSKEPINAISYHYIIGNGKGMEDGEIESDIRKRLNLWGVHVSKGNTDRNFRGIGICIIGNLEKQPMTSKQYESLLNLTRQLQKKYDIKSENIGFHGKIKGESTKCPGKNFPYQKFKADLKK